MGNIQCLDLRMNKMQGSLKGPGGAVKGLALHPELPIIASVGLDRFLRVHDVDSKALLCKLYLKQHLTAVAWSDAQPQAAMDEQDNGDAAKSAAADGLSTAVSDDVAVDVSELRKPRALSSKRAGSQKKGKSQRKKQKRHSEREHLGA